MRHRPMLDALPPYEEFRVSDPIRLLAFAGSLRAGSYNRKLIRVLAAGAEAAGAEVDLVELRELPFPVYDGDLESSDFPENVHILQDRLALADGLLIATPEYNGSVPGVLKNALDWLSRAQRDGKPGTALFTGKPAGIVSASPGALGGLRSLIVLRDMLAKFGLWVAPSQVAVGSADKAFTTEGDLADEARRKQVHAVGAAVARAAAAFKSLDSSNA